MLYVKRISLALFCSAALLSGMALAADDETKVEYNEKLLELPVNEWVKIHQQKKDDPVYFQYQQHGGGCFDSKRCRIVLFGSNTHGKDWSNSPLIYDVLKGEWQRLYPNDDPSTYTTNGAGVAVAGVNGDHPWAMHTFGAINYDPKRDEMVVASYPGHMVPGRFSNALKDVWGLVKRHPTWVFRFSDNTWMPLDCEPRHFFPYCAAYDPDREVIIGYGGGSIAELSGEPRSWKALKIPSMTEWHNNAVYDSRNKALVVYGTRKLSDDVIVYRPESGEHLKMPTTGSRPPADQHNPMAFDEVNGCTVVVADRDLGDKKIVAETWLYDLARDSWLQLEKATLNFPSGMNYCMFYDPRHKVCLLVAGEGGLWHSPVTVYALRVGLAL